MVTREVDGTPVFDCDGNCGCCGCFTGDITYVLGGFLMTFDGLQCPCEGGSGDEAGRSRPYSNWSAGQLTWKLPIGWKRLTSDYDNSAFADVVDYASHLDSNSRPLLIGNSEDFYIQVFTISEDGTSSVERFGYRLTRSRWSIWGEVTNIQ